MMYGYSLDHIRLQAYRPQAQGRGAGGAAGGSPEQRHVWQVSAQVNQRASRRPQGAPNAPNA